MNNIKNIFRTGLAAVLLAGISASCSDESLLTQGGDGTVTFSAVLEDGTATRAFGDGTSAKQLRYAVYDNNGTLVTDGRATVSNKTATVTLQLALGQTYDIAFFATRSLSTYTFNAADKSVTVNYDQMSGGAGSSNYAYDDDCFYKVVKGYVAGSSVQEDVILKRPVAQVNFGTNDLDADAVKKFYGSTYVYSGLKTKACTRLDLLTGEASDETEIALPLKRNFNEAFPVEGGYKYLSVTYILVGDPSPVRDLTLGTGKSRGDYAGNAIKELTIPNAPTQRNYRTNIYGSLLTSSSDWNVTIEPIYDTEAYNIWTGQVKNPVQDPDNENLYTVNNPAELAGLAKMVNAGNDFAGKTVLLTTDCDLNNRNWTPIGTNEHSFNGVFDGQGHTISNLNVTLGKTSIPAGLFGAIKSNGANKSEVKNLVIDGATINTLAATPANYSTGVAVGWIYTGKCVEGVTVRNATIDAYRWTGGVVGKGYGSVNNCTAEDIDITMHFENLNGEWDNCDKAGAIMGQQDEGRYTLTGNKASRVKISGYRHIGGLFGYVNSGDGSGKKQVTDNSVTDAVISQNLFHNYKSIASGELLGEISGYFGSNIVDENNTASGVTIDAIPIVKDAAALIAAATNGGDIILGADLDLSSAQGTLTLTAPTTIDLAGNTLKVKGGAIVNESELTIEGEGTITSDGTTISSLSGAKIVINDGTIETTGGENKYAVYVEGDAEINGGTLHSTQSPALNFNVANEYQKSHTLVVNGGTFITDNNYALNAYAGNCSKTHKVVINGGTFMGPSGARADGAVDMTIEDGYFIQTSATATGHGFCAGAESYGSDKCKVTINGGWFYGNAHYAICNANQATTIVNGGYLNKTGGGFTLGAGRSLNTLATPATAKVNGATYSFGYQVK